MKGLVIIIPYFCGGGGNLPKWMPVFLYSCGKNAQVDFLIFTDDNSILSCPQYDNVRIEVVAFDDMKVLFTEKLGNCYLDTPYKLCDYRPTYGHVFQERISNYKYWGYCDVDIVLGDIMCFLDNICYENYDRCFSYGHFTIYRNCEKCNTLYQKDLGAGKFFTFDYVKSTTLPCNFDECGMNMICRQSDMNFYDSSHHLQIQFDALHFKSIHGNNVTQIITYENGKVYTYIVCRDGRVLKMEAMYVHFEDRKEMPVHVNLNVGNVQFLITHKGLVPFSLSDVSSYFAEYGKIDSREENMNFISERNARWNRQKREKLIREIRYNKLSSFLVLYERWKGINYLKKHR